MLRLLTIADPEVQGTRVLHCITTAAVPASRAFRNPPSRDQVRIVQNADLHEFHEFREEA